MTTRPASIDGERGTTLVEVLVVLSLTAIVAIPMMMVLQSGLRTERRQNARLDLELEMALVADRFERDVRMGRPAAARAGGPSSTNMGVAWTQDDGFEQLVVWSVDAGNLRRSASVPATGVVLSDFVLLENVVSVAPAFRYWTENGREVSASADRIDSCAARVTLEIRAVVGDVESSRTIEVAHRTRPAESC